MGCIRDNMSKGCMWSYLQVSISDNKWQEPHLCDLILGCVCMYVTLMLLVFRVWFMSQKLISIFGKTRIKGVLVF